MVADEIVDLYGYPTDKIDLVRNGIPLAKFQFDPDLRERSRSELKLKPDQIALLFAGSGWERKGLLFAIEAKYAISASVNGRHCGSRSYLPICSFGQVADRFWHSASDSLLAPPPEQGLAS